MANGIVEINNQVTVKPELLDLAIRTTAKGQELFELMKECDAAGLYTSLDAPFFFEVSADSLVSVSNPHYRWPSIRPAPL